MSRYQAAIVLVLVLLGARGCEVKPCAIRGTVTHKGEKLTWPKGGRLLVIFVPENRRFSDSVYAAETDTATSTFSIASIPSGRYQVAVQQFDGKYMDAFGGAHDLGKSRIYCRIDRDNQVIDIDVPAR